MTGIEDVEPLRACARALREAGDMYGAEMALKRVLGLDPQNPKAHHELALIYWQEKREPECIGHFDRAMALDPGNEQYLAEKKKMLSFFGGLTPSARSERMDADVVPAAPGLQDMAKAASAPPGTPGRRLLTLLDYSAQPQTLGDTLINMVASMAAAAEVGAGKIDVCILCDPNRPHLDPDQLNAVDRDHRNIHLHSYLLPITQLNPLLGSLHLFNATHEADAFLRGLNGDYALWPTLELLGTSTFIGYDAMIRVKRHWEAFGTVPQLHFGSNLRNWAAGFYREFAPHSIPVTVNLRANPRYHPERNSHLPAWKALFQHCADRYPVTFVVVGDPSEVVEDMRALPNVVFGKSLGTSLLQDLALIRFSAYHLSSPSGPAAMAIFGKRPYCICQWTGEPHVEAFQGVFIPSGEGEFRHPFSSGLQIYSTAPETPDTLMRHFERLWKSRDWSHFEPLDDSAFAPPHLKRKT